MGATLILKLAAECNLRCDYCYWFAEPGTGSVGAVASEEVLQRFVDRVDEYFLSEAGAEGLTISLHGGEPLLLGKRRFAHLCHALSECASRRSRRLSLACQTNGMMIDEEWISVFRFFGVSVGVSLDGPQAIHDARRIDRFGRGSHQKSLRGYLRMRDAGLDPAILAVWSPGADARTIVDYFADELRCDWFDVLLPDTTRDAPRVDCSRFFCDLFDIWLEELLDRGIHVRICDAIARASMGLASGMESIGRSRVSSASVGSLGQYELLDVLYVAGQGLARTGMTIFETSIEDFYGSEAYRSQGQQSWSLCDTCQSCRFSVQCGGGYLPSRWSAVNGFDNPSANCESLFRIFEHCESRLSDRIAGLLDRIRLQQGVLASEGR